MNNVEKSVAGIKYGLRGKITVNDEIYDGIMVSQGLDNEEIADVMNYILNEWGNSYTEQITTEQVNKIPKNLVD
jgi:mono/diheme cytochrome c family protein